MALEQSLDRGKTIETKAEEKEKKSYLRQLCERLHLDPAKDYSREDAESARAFRQGKEVPCREDRLL